MPETGIKMMYIVVLLYVLLAIYARKVLFLPQPPVHLTLSVHIWLIKQILFFIKTITLFLTSNNNSVKCKQYL